MGRITLLDRIFRRTDMRDVQGQGQAVGDAGEQASGAKALESAYSFIGTEQRASPFGDLNYGELRDVYENSASVRKCVDANARKIATLPWVIRTKPGGDIEHAQVVKAFFQDPNDNAESIRNILQKLTVDILVLDSGILEKVFSLSGKNLLEIIARDGATFTAIYDQFGGLMKYIQRVTGHTIEFDRREIVHFQLYPRTWNFYGTPVIETILDEVTALMHTTAEIGTAFTRDEIPEGLLVIEKLGNTAWDRIKEGLTSEVGKVKKKLQVLRNVGKTEWLHFKRPFREMQVAELSEKIDKAVRDHFGVDEELNVRADMQIALTQMLGYYINQQVVREFYDDVYFKLYPVILDKEIALARDAKGRFIKNVASTNLLDEEELRRLVGDEFFVPEEALD